MKELQKRATKSKSKASPLSAEEALQLLRKLQGSLTSNSSGNGDEARPLFECAVCLGELEEEKARILRRCSHSFCDFCLDRILKTMHGGKSVCPMCRNPFGKSDVLQGQELEAASKVPDSEEDCTAAASAATEKRIRDKESEFAAHGTPPKVQALIQGLEESWASDPDQKAVIFSQFTGMLDCVQEALAEKGIISSRIDGSMSIDQRNKCVQDFNRDGGPMVLVLSLRAAGVGLNLTRANLVFMMDLWWNYGVEEQAMDRVYRIGQTRPVRVVRYVCARTLEERMLQIQEAKRVLGQAALSKMPPEQLRRARVDDLSRIFQPMGSESVFY